MSALIPLYQDPLYHKPSYTGTPINLADVVSKLTHNIGSANSANSANDLNSFLVIELLRIVSQIPSTLSWLGWIMQFIWQCTIVFAVNFVIKNLDLRGILQLYENFMFRLLELLPCLGYEVNIYKIDLYGFATNAANGKADANKNLHEKICKVFQVVMPYDFNSFFYYNNRESGQGLQGMTVQYPRPRMLWKYDRSISFLPIIFHGIEQNNLESMSSVKIFKFYYYGKKALKNIEAQEVTDPCYLKQSTYIAALDFKGNNNCTMTNVLSNPLIPIKNYQKLDAIIGKFTKIQNCLGYKNLNAISIDGCPGLGKTSFMDYFSHKHRDDYHIVYIDMIKNYKTSFDVIFNTIQARLEDFSKSHAFAFAGEEPSQTSYKGVVIMIDEIDKYLDMHLEFLHNQKEAQKKENENGNGKGTENGNENVNRNEKNYDRNAHANSNTNSHLNKNGIGNTNTNSDENELEIIPSWSPSPQRYCCDCGKSNDETNIVQCSRCRTWVHKAGTGCGSAKPLINSLPGETSYICQLCFMNPFIDDLPPLGPVDIPRCGYNQALDDSFIKPIRLTNSYMGRTEQSMNWKSPPSNLLPVQKLHNSLKCVLTQSGKNSKNSRSGKSQKILSETISPIDNLDPNKLRITEPEELSRDVRFLKKELLYRLFDLLNMKVNQPSYLIFCTNNFGSMWADLSEKHYQHLKALHNRFIKIHFDHIHKENLIEILMDINDTFGKKLPENYLDPEAFKKVTDQLPDDLSLTVREMHHTLIRTMYNITDFVRILTSEGSADKIYDSMHDLQSNSSSLVETEIQSDGEEPLQAHEDITRHVELEELKSKAGVEAVV